MSASYPTSVKTFTSRNAGDTIQPSHINDLQDEVNAVETGLLTGPLTIGGQIKFPAAQSVSTDANTLDDYEEGSWTPVIGGSGGTVGQTYSIQVGRYIKVGKRVTLWFHCIFSAKGTITGNVEIQGLPFVSDTITNAFFPTSIGFFGLATNWIALTATIQSAVSVFNIYGIAAAGTSNLTTSLVTADLNNTSEIDGTLHYIASA